MAMRLFFVLVTVAGSGYLLYTDRGDRKVTIAALAASSFGFLLQLNMISKAPSMLSIVQDSLSTDLSPVQLLSVARLLSEVDDGRGRSC